MSTTDSLSREQLPLKDFAERAYLDYAMYVILDRALPHLADGLKPVQRRIVYAMSELGLSAQSKPKKSARTVGDVLGKYHPHGDMACYEAMVLMAQPFSTRYPLIDGQGNWGSPDDPKSFAAMRYTESRLTPYAQTLLSELEFGTVEWAPNFDGSLEEPRLLPARLPNVLLNGATGIAVGMATDIPPHNLREVVAACVLLLDDPTASWEAIQAVLPGPDFPTPGEITTPAAELLSLYQTGNGSVRQRGRWEVEDEQIVITALPYLVSGAKLLEQIAGLMQAKKLPWLDDLRDESDHEHPTRLVLVPKVKRGDDLDAYMAHLCANTDLERSYRVNLNMIGLDGRPRVKDLRTILLEWLSYRIGTVRRRLEHRLQKVNDRLHVLEGLLIAFLNIDEVIAIIRHNDEPGPVLMERFRLTERQADAILDLRLRHLAKLEEMKIRGEQDELAEERKTLEATLGSPDLLNDLVKRELKADAEKHGDARRSPLVERTAVKAMAPLIATPAEPVTVILSKAGWIRCAKGHEIDPAGLNYRTGDDYFTSVRGSSNRPAYVLDSQGRAYQLNVAELPSARGQGEPLTGRLNPPPGASFVSLLTGSDDEHYVLAADNGYGFIARLGELQSRNRAGKAVVTLGQGVGLLPPRKIENVQRDRVAIASSAGRLLLFPVADLPVLGKGKGLKLLALKAAAKESVAALTVVPAGAGLRVYSGKRSMLLADGNLEVFAGARATRGTELPRGFQRVEALECVLPNT